MILAVAVFVGFLAVLVRYRRESIKHLAAIPLRHAWLLGVALVLQIPFLRSPAAPLEQLRVQQILFVSSLLILVFFVGLNWRLAGMLIVGAGLVGNLVVILANGGAMPISPGTLVKINPGSQPADWTPGTHYPGSKDVILEKEDTRLAGLSDALALRIPLMKRAAFSLGDLLIALGVVFVMLDGRLTVPRPGKGAVHET